MIDPGRFAVCWTGGNENLLLWKGERYQPHQTKCWQCTELILVLLFHIITSTWISRQICLIPWIFQDLSIVTQVTDTMPKKQLGRWRCSFFGDCSILFHPSKIQWDLTRTNGPLNKNARAIRFRSTFSGSVRWSFFLGFKFDYLLLDTNPLASGLSQKSPTLCRSWFVTYLQSWHLFRKRKKTVHPPVVKNGLFHPFLATPVKLSIQLNQTVVPFPWTTVAIPLGCPGKLLDQRLASVAEITPKANISHL